MKKELFKLLKPSIIEGIKSSIKNREVEGMFRVPLLDELSPKQILEALEEVKKDKQIIKILKKL